MDSGRHLLWISYIRAVFYPLNTLKTSFHEIVNTVI
jgi:hypothetical protein